MILLEIKDWLGFSVIAAIIASITSLTAIFLKEIFIDNRKARKAKDAIFKNHILYLAYSTKDLIDALLQIAEEFPPDYLSKKMLKLKIEKRTNDTSDPHYRKYKFTRTLYRLSAFFAWLEVNRLDVSFLESSSVEKTNAVQNKISQIRILFSEGRLLEIHKSDWREWSDRQIFNEEQRAIGEGMIENREGKYSVVGFGKFQEVINEYVINKKPLWLEPIILFLSDMEYEKEFRKERILYLLKCLDELLSILEIKKHIHTHDKVKKLLMQNSNIKILEQLEAVSNKNY